MSTIQELKAEAAKSAHPRRGRPPLPPGEARNRDVRVPVSEADGAALDAWAARLGRPLAALLREMGLRAARRHRGAP